MQQPLLQVISQCCHVYSCRCLFLSDNLSSCSETNNAQDVLCPCSLAGLLVKDDIR